MQKEEGIAINKSRLAEFKKKVLISKLQLNSLLLGLKKEGKRIYGVGAPSRASTLVNYAGLDDGILDCIVEIKGSHKIGKYMPGTLNPVVEESELFDKQPEYALLLSWHIAYELMTNLRKKGYKGKFIVPLPVPEIIA